MADQQREEEQEGNESGTISLDELLYSAASYHAIVKPVTLTMVLSALAVTYVTTPSQKEMMEQSMGMIEVIDVSDSNSSSSNARLLGLGLVNGLIVVCFIAAITFLIVILYKYRCMKLLTGYMVFSSGTLLGLIGGLFFKVFIDCYSVPLDKVSFSIILFNFALVGILAIFYQKGIPAFITQIYLVFISVLLAWELSTLNTWTAWTLLVMLALYDLCSVLTSCGPLKLLVDLMSKEDAPDLSGLLYEATLPVGVQRPGREPSENNADNNLSRRDTETRSNEDDGTTVTNPGNVEHGSPSSTQLNTSNSSLLQESRPEQVQSLFPDEGEENSVDIPSGRVPLAIALIYRLEISSPECYSSLRGNNTSGHSFSPVQLRSHVQVQFPIRGGKIVPKDEFENESGTRNNINRISGNSNDELQLKYVVLNRHGRVKRVLIVNEEGKVFQEIEDERRIKDSNGGGSIKLGLGDFIFYSVLVAKAVQYSFTTFAACTLVILSGLGATLLLLAVYHKALPALPISIFLGVVFYLLTRVVIEPWIESIMKLPYYV